MAAVGAAAIQSGFESSYAGLAIALLLVPAVVGLVLEPVLYLHADRHPRRWFVCGGLFAMAAATLVAAAAPSVVVLAIALSLSGVASGCAVTLTQATLVDARPLERERVMARWVLAALAGDLIAPLLLGALAVVGLGWRAGYAIGAVAVLLCALALLGAQFPLAAAREEEEPGLLSGLRIALGNRQLLLWLAGCALCDLLDEILVVFAVLHMRDAGLGVTWQSAALTAFVLGGAVGVAAVDRLVGLVAPRRLLAATSIACAALYIIWVAMAAEATWLSIALFALVGATAAPLYPLATAQAYAALPGRSGAVNAAASLFDPITLALPFLLGWLADAHGTALALAMLVAQPIGLAFIAGLSSWTRSGSPR